ncbi:Uncharacterised protein [Mesomycoplasma hyorhinis]|nr:Uncharacterised protein [Mesomycoplasma hyorhinis]
MIAKINGITAETEIKPDQTPVVKNSTNKKTTKTTAHTTIITIYAE